MRSKMRNGRSNLKEMQMSDVENGGLPRFDERLLRATLSRRRFLVGSAMAVTAATLAACGTSATQAPTGSSGPTPSAPLPAGASGSPSAAKKGGTLRLALADANTSDTLSPYVQNTSFTPVMFLALYDPLVFVDNNFQPQPGLAESWESTDGQTWVFHIRQGVQFHDGSALTAQDVVYSLQQIIRPETGTYTGGILAPILKPANITALDDHTVQIKLDQKYVFLPNVLGLRYSLVFKNGTSDSDLKTKNPIGTGPFMYKSFVSGQSFSGTRNPNYWRQGLPYLDGVELSSIPETSSRLQALLSDQIDIAGYVGASVLPQLKGDSSHEAFPFKDSGWQAMVCDLTVAPFDDPRVVQAMKLALNRQQFVDLAYGGYGSIGYDNPIPKGDPYFPTNLDVKQDIAAAKDLLKQAGHSNGLTLPFPLVTDNGFSETDILAQVAQQQLQAIGITFSLKQGGPTFWDTVWLKQPFYIPDYNRRHPYEAFTLFSGSQNMTKYKDPAWLATINDALSTTDTKQQLTDFQSAITTTAQKNGYLLPAYAPRIHAKGVKVQGVRPNFVGFFDFAEAYLA